MKKPIKYWFLWITSFPWDIFVIVCVLLIRLFWGRKLEWNEGLWCELKPDSWPTRSWYRYKENGRPVEVLGKNKEKYGRWLTWGGTCLGHGGFFGPGKTGEFGIDTIVERHEHIHVEQYEVAMFTSFFMCLFLFFSAFFFGFPLWGACVGAWFLGYALKSIGGWVVAWFRGEDPYWGSVHEESAYAIVNDYIRKKEGR